MSLQCEIDRGMIDRFIKVQMDLIEENMRLQKLLRAAQQRARETSGELKKLLGDKQYGITRRSDLSSSRSHSTEWIKPANIMLIRPLQSDRIACLDQQFADLHLVAPAKADDVQGPPTMKSNLDNRIDLIVTNDDGLNGHANFSLTTVNPFETLGTFSEEVCMQKPDIMDASINNNESDRLSVMPLANTVANDIATGADCIVSLPVNWDTCETGTNVFRANIKYVDFSVGVVQCHRSSLLTRLNWLVGEISDLMALDLYPHEDPNYATIAILVPHIEGKKIARKIQKQLDKDNKVKELTPATGTQKTQRKKSRKRSKHRRPRKK